jgi:transposase-like protein
MVHLYLSGNYTIKQIASILDLSQDTIRRWLQTPDIKKAVEQYQLEEDAVVNASMRSLRIKAVETQKELLEADNEMVQAIVARDILQMTGHKAPEKKTVQVNVSYEQRIKELMNKEVSADYVIDDANAEIRTEGE